MFAPPRRHTAVTFPDDPALPTEVVPLNPAPLACPMRAGFVAPRPADHFARGHVRLSTAAPKLASLKLAVVVSVTAVGTPAALPTVHVAGLKRVARRVAGLTTHTAPEHGDRAQPFVARPAPAAGDRRGPTAGSDGVRRLDRSLNCVDRPAPRGPPGHPPCSPREKDGRLYVFAQPVWNAGARARPGRGSSAWATGRRARPPSSIPMMRSSSQSRERPAPRDLPTTRPPRSRMLRVPTLGDRLVEAKPGARSVARRHDRRRSSWRAATTYLSTGMTRRRCLSRRPSTSPQVPSRWWGLQPQAAGALPPLRLAWKARLPGRPASSASRPAPRRGCSTTSFRPRPGLGPPADVHDRGYFTALYYSPFVDELLADIALAFWRTSLRPGSARAPTVVALFSAQDTVSHSYGVESERTRRPGAV